MSKTALKARTEWKVPGHPWCGCKRGGKGADWDLSSARASVPSRMDSGHKIARWDCLAFSVWCRISSTRGPCRVTVWSECCGCVDQSGLGMLSPQKQRTPCLCCQHALQHCLSRQHSTQPCRQLRRAWRRLGEPVGNGSVCL